MLNKSFLPISGNRLQTFFSTFLLLTALFIIGVGILGNIGLLSLWDDSYMFARYANNALENGQWMAWNPGGGPTYGLTSPLYFSLVLVLRLFIARPALLMSLASILSGLGFFILFARLVHRYGPGTITTRRWTITGIALILAHAITQVAIHLTNGMDTMFSLAYLSLYLLLCFRFERVPTKGRSIILGIGGGLMYFVRPDLLVFSVLFPLSFAIFGETREIRRYGWLAGGVTTLLVILEVWFASHFFGSAVPLAVYAKALSLYGNDLKHIFALVPSLQLLAFLRWYGYLLLPIGFWIYFHRKRLLRRGFPIQKAMLVATALFAIYYLCFVLQIMPYASRFYYPLLPVLLWMAAEGVQAFILWIQTERPPLSPSKQSGLLLLGSLILLGTLYTPALQVSQWIMPKILQQRLGSFDLRDHYQGHTKISNVWYCLQAVADLPDDVVIATTEVGLPSVLAPHKTIIDLAGLNETQFAQSRLTGDRLFKSYQPDIVYLPRPDFYGEMYTEITTHSYFREHYKQYTAESLNTTLGVALKKTSPYYPTLHDWLVNGCEPKTTEAQPSPPSISARYYLTLPID